MTLKSVNSVSVKKQDSSLSTVSVSQNTEPTYIIMITDIMQCLTKKSQQCSNLLSENNSIVSFHTVCVTSVSATVLVLQ